MQNQQNGKFGRCPDSEDIGEEFGIKLSINPNLPANTDFTGGQAMDTPNSFKLGNTPTTPFGLTHLQFPASITLQNYNQCQVSVNANATSNLMSIADASTEELLNFMPKTPLQPSTQVSSLNLRQGFAGVPTLATSSNAEHSNPITSDPRSSMPTEAQIPKVKEEVATAKTKKKKNARMKRGRATSSGAVKDESRWKSWTREEEVFLVGAVMDRFFKRGSLSSTRADDLTSDDSWSVIKNYYETAWKNYYLKTGINIPTERPANALSRHYKVMKARISQSDITGEDGENFRTYFDEWEKIYNVNNCLVSELNTSNKAGKGAIRKSSQPRDFTKRKVRLSIRQAPSEFL